MKEDKKKSAKKFIQYALLFIFIFVGIPLFVILVEDIFIITIILLLLFFTYDYYQKNKEGRKEIERLSKDWSFCKDLLDKERAKNSIK